MGEFGPGTKMVGICKELAPTKDAPTDEKLGVGSFQSKYFGSNPMYVDTEYGFYNAFGRNKITSQLSWNPFTIVYKLIATTFRFFLADLSSVDGNLKGEGLVVGGLLVIRDGKLIYHAKEPFDGHFNYIEIAAASKGEPAPSGLTEGTFVDSK